MNVPRTDAFSGAVLTGGRSSRMGVDKALFEVDGAALAATVARALRDAGANEVLAVGGDRPLLKGLDVFDRTIDDSHPGEGPLGAIIDAMRAATSQIVVVLACDTPAIDAATPLALVRALVEHDADVAIANVDGRRQPLTAAWRSDRVVESLDAAYAAGERAPRRALGSLRVVDVDGIAPDAVLDLDRPSDVDRYAARVRNTPPGASR